ncbi:MAG: hypothetical protein EA397_03960 [Deltaproteobacteria bacterium]|nr:MAG: hypothetical protein EA397_03960 [Deltaproteobacteria bacterium]
MGCNPLELLQERLSFGGEVTVQEEPPNAEVCAARWADDPSPTAARTQGCMQWWLKVAYGTEDPAELDFDPEVGHPEEREVTAAQLDRMRAHVQAICPEGATAPAPCVRARQYFEGAARHRFRIGQSVDLLSFEPQLRKVLAGERLTADDLAPYGVALDAVVRWRLAAAIRARHGIVPEHPDLQRFLFEPDVVEGADSLPLPRVEPGSESALTEADHHNLAMLVGP